MNQICKNCGKEFTHKNDKDACSVKCTKILKYGSLENYNKMSLEKRHSTIINKHGSLENYNSKQAEHRKQVAIEKWGVS